MFGISFSEVLLILIISLLIFGPEQLPVIARKFGKIINSIRNFTKTLQEGLYEKSGFNQLDTLRQEMQVTLQQIKTQFQPQLLTKNTKEDLDEGFCLHEFEFFYQPELEFDREPELFDE